MDPNRVHIWGRHRGPRWMVCDRPLDSSTFHAEVNLPKAGHDRQQGVESGGTAQFVGSRPIVDGQLTKVTSAQQPFKCPLASAYTALELNAVR
jgi:hypothetical protein